MTSTNWVSLYVEVQMLQPKTKTVIFAVVGGIIVTLVTGLFDHTPSGLMGAVWYGYPLVWLEMLVVAPQYFPWVVRPIRLVIDVVVWVIVVWIILFLISKIRKK
jgi:hypothetical protein